MKIPPFFENISVNKSHSCLIIDIDGTLLPDNLNDIDVKVMDKLTVLQKEHTLYLCSNSKNRKRNENISEITKIPIIKSQYKKPNKQIISSITEKSLSFPIIVIGDKYLTDELFAFNIKAQYIRVRRKITGNEKFYIKLINLLDDIIYGIMKK